jgi:putative peptidoglycan lipid II flippase
MIKKSFFITFIFGINILVQLISQIVITRFFGAGFDIDVFLAAVTLPTIIVTVIYGTLNDTFLPIFGRIKEESDRERYFVSALLIIGFIGFVLASALGFFSQNIATFFYAARGVVFVKAVATMMPSLFYAVPLSIIATLMGSYFYNKKNFYRFPLAQVIGNILNIILVFLFHNSLGVNVLVLGFVLNIFSQIIFCFPKSIATNKNNFPNFLKDFTDLKNIGKLILTWIPLIISLFAIKSDSLIVRSYASHLPTGYQVYFNLIYKIFSLSAGVCTIGIQILLLPHLVEHFSNKNHDKAFSQIAKSKTFGILISAFVVFLVVFLSPYVINILFVGGKFSESDAQKTIALLPLFIIPAIGWGISSIFYQPLIALQKVWSLAILNSFALLLAWGSAYYTNIIFGPLFAITVGLIVLLFTGIIGSEILWQHYKKKLGANLGTN